MYITAVHWSSKWVGGTTDRSSGGPSCRHNAPIKSPAIPQSHPQEYKWLWPPLKSHNTQGSGVRHIYTWIIHIEYKVCLSPPLNEKLVKMLYFHYRNIRQLFGEQRNTVWLRHNDLSTSDVLHHLHRHTSYITQTAQCVVAALPDVKPRMGLPCLF